MKPKTRILKFERGMRALVDRVAERHQSLQNPRSSLISNPAPQTLTVWGYNCVKSLRSSYTGLYPQKPDLEALIDPAIEMHPNLKPQTLPNPHTLHPEPQTLPTPHTLHPAPQTFPTPQTLNPEPHTLP